MSTVPTESGAGHSPFVPLLLGLLVLLLWTAFQTVELLGERSALHDAHAAQDAPLEQAHKIRTAADSLASKTQTLADSGNPDARIVITNLKQRGITVNPTAKTLAPPP